MNVITSALSNAVDDLSITVGNQTISGWQEIRLTRSLRIFPSSFEIGLTENYPIQADAVVKPGDPCTIKIGQDTVLTGYVDRYVAEIAAGSHNIKIEGRSKCADLYDCGSENPMSQGNISPFDYAKQLTKPFGISVSQIGKGNGRTYPGITGNLTESPYRLIEVVSRYSAFLVYDDVDGNLVLADVKAGEHVNGGFIQAQNVLSASVMFAKDQRFSEYHVEAVPIPSFFTMSNPTSNINQVGYATDSNIKRHRPLYIVSPQLSIGNDIANDLALWEKNRRYGQGNVIQIVADSWRDVPLTGKIWTPNFTAFIDVPALDMEEVSDWVIGDVTYRRSIHGGTTAEITMMPQEAFGVAPTTPIDIITQLGIQQANQAKSQ